MRSGTRLDEVQARAMLLRKACSVPIDALFAGIGSGPDGLTASEAAARQRTRGPNRIVLRGAGALPRGTAAVLRKRDTGDAAVFRLPVEKLVPGDVIVLSPGDAVPADARLLSSRDLRVSQALLTGEAESVEKVATSRPEAGLRILEIPNLCVLGTMVVSGSATALVVATGGETYLSTFIGSDNRRHAKLSMR